MRCLCWCCCCCRCYYYCFGCCCFCSSSFSLQVLWCVYLFRSLSLALSFQLTECLDVLRFNVLCVCCAVCLWERVLCFYFLLPTIWLRSNVLSVYGSERERVFCIVHVKVLKKRQRGKATADHKKRMNK